MNSNVVSARAALAARVNDQTLKNVEKLWNSWPVSVRQDFVKRAQGHVLSSIQTSQIAKKQWAQWQVTLRFCLDDLFNEMREATKHNFEDEKSFGYWLNTVLKEQENAINVEAFDKKVDGMMAEMKNTEVAGFDPASTAHRTTLRQIRSLYAI